MIEMLLIAFVPAVIVYVIVSVHYNGYRKGYKAGFEQGKTNINKYALQMNRALNERVSELQGAINDKRLK